MPATRTWPDFMRTRNTRVRPGRAAVSISCCVLIHGAADGGASAGFLARAAYRA